MPFVWVNEPQTPPIVDPIFYGSNTVSNQVGLVANTVVVHPPPMGVLSYNTPNVGYDVIYQYNSLNVSSLHTEHLIGGNITANLATINTFSINTATIGNASVSNLTAGYIYMTSNSTANMHMVTKGYVDALIANSTPQGGNLQLLIQATGDLLAGVSDNTANRVAVGTSGQILSVTNTTNTKVKWTSISGTGNRSSFRNIFIRTHTDYYHCNTKVQLHQADEIVMDDGTVTRNWPLTTADISANGVVNGLDTGTMKSNTWYEIYAIRNPTTNSRGLLFHQALDRKPWVTSNDAFTFSASLILRRDQNGIDNILKVAQQFVAPISGNVTSAEMACGRSATPITGNCWLTIEAQDAQGNATGIALATSNYRLVRDLPRVSGGAGRIRFTFDNPYSVTASGNYCLVYNSDCPFTSIGSDFYTAIFGINTDTYPSGNGRVFSANTNTWKPSTTQSIIDFNFRVFIEANNTPVVMPSGYTQKCLLSYVSTGHGLFFREYTQRNRKIVTLHHWYWRFIDFASGAQYLPFNQPYQLPISLVFTLDVGYGVPPVPCMVQIGYASYPADGIYLSFADVHAPSVLANSTLTLVPVESDGVVYANTTSGVGAYHNNPVLVEHQAVLTCLMMSFPQLVPSTIEF